MTIGWQSGVLGSVSEALCPSAGNKATYAMLMTILKQFSGNEVSLAMFMTALWSSVGYKVSLALFMAALWSPVTGSVYDSLVVIYWQ